MCLKRFFIYTVLFCLLTFQFVSAQQQDSDSGESFRIKETAMIDVFGAANDCDLGARLDALRIELNSDSNSKGYLITYRGTEDILANQTDTFVRNFWKRIKTQMVFLRMDDSSVVFIDGGFRKSSNYSTEVWFAPQDGTVPSISGAVEKPKLRKDKAYKYVETSFYVPDAEIMDESDEAAEEDAETDVQDEEINTADLESEKTIEQENFDEDFSQEFDGFHWINEDLAKLFKTDKTSKGVLIFYTDDESFYVEKVRQYIEEKLQEKSGKEKIDSSRVRIVFGGYRDDTAIEFWIVPDKAKEPAPTPQERKPSQQE